MRLVSDSIPIYRARLEYAPHENCFYTVWTSCGRSPQFAYSGHWTSMSSGWLSLDGGADTSPPVFVCAALPADHQYPLSGSPTASIGALVSRGLRGPAIDPQRPVTRHSS